MGRQSHTTFLATLDYIVLLPYSVIQLSTLPEAFSPPETLTTWRGKNAKDDQTGSSRTSRRIWTISVMFARRQCCTKSTRKSPTSLNRVSGQVVEFLRRNSVWRLSRNLIAHCVIVGSAYLAFRSRPTWPLWWRANWWSLMGNPGECPGAIFHSLAMFHHCFYGLPLAVFLAASASSQW